MSVRGVKPATHHLGWAHMKQETRGFAVSLGLSVLPDKVGLLALVSQGVFLDFRTHLFQGKFGWPDVHG